MTNSLNCQSQQIPAYSGITINITNPTLNPPGVQPVCNCQHTHQANANKIPAPQYINKGEYLEPVNIEQNYVLNQNPAPYQEQVPAQNNALSQVPAPNPVQNTKNEEAYNNQAKNPNQNRQENAISNQQAYPPAYYLNNYNYIQGNNPNSATETGTIKPDNNDNNIAPNQNEEENKNDSLNETEQDTNISKEIINELDVKAAEEKELEKKGKKTKIVALTNEYIMSLENYLNNPNTDIRLMAAKDILTRLDEDHDRYDDAALNALLNKMLQDPNKLVRIAAMSALSSDLASGNDYTVQLLNQIQQNPQADPEDVLEASQILLKRSATTEVRYIPQPQNTEQKAE